MKYFALQWMQHGIWVNTLFVDGQHQLAKELAEVAMLPGVSTITVQEIHEENASEYGMDHLFIDSANGCYPYATILNRKEA